MSSNEDGQKEIEGGKVEITGLPRSHVTDTPTSLQSMHSEQSLELKNVISNIVSTEIRNALGAWISEHQQYPQSIDPSETFRRMSHGLQQQEEGKWAKMNSNKTSTAVNSNKTNTAFDANEWRRAKILAKRKQIKDNMILTPSQNRKPAFNMKGKNKYIATVAQNDVESREN